MKKAYIISIILFCLLTVLVSVQTFWKFAPEISLGGVQEQIKPVKFSAERWFNGNFQKTFDAFVNRKIGFKGLMVKSNNQVDYSLFHENNAGGSRVVVGRKNWLFQQTAINEALYAGSDPEEAIRAEVDKLAECCSLLTNLGRNVMFFAAPNKVNVYPEYIPYRYKKHWRKGLDTYDNLVRMIREETDVPCIDGREFADQLKAQGVENIYPQGGAHWSVYGSCLVIEDICARASNLVRNAKINYVVERPHFMDNDLVKLMNLWTPDVFLGPDLPYADGSEAEYPMGRKPSILFVGDSACHLLSYAAVYSELFSDVYMVYYNNSIVIHRKGQERKKFKIDKKPPGVYGAYNKLLNFDIIVLSMSQQHMTFPERMISYGFPNFVVNLLEEHPEVATNPEKILNHGIH